MQDEAVRQCVDHVDGTELAGDADHEGFLSVIIDGIDHPAGGPVADSILH